MHDITNFVGGEKNFRMLCYTHVPVSHVSALHRRVLYTQPTASPRKRVEKRASRMYGRGWRCRQPPLDLTNSHVAVNGARGIVGLRAHCWWERQSPYVTPRIPGSWDDGSWGCRDIVHAPHVLGRVKYRLSWPSKQRMFATPTTIFDVQLSSPPLDARFRTVP